METASSGTDTVPHPLPRMVGTRRGGEMVQAEILHRTRARWPGRNKTRNRILRAGTSAEGCRGIPRKRGSGGGPAGAVRRPRDTPGDPLVSSHRWERNSPRRAKPCKVRRAESSRPTGIMVHEGRADRCPAPTTSQADHSKAGRRKGQAPSLRGGWETFCGREQAGKIL